VIGNIGKGFRSSTAVEVEQTEAARAAKYSDQWEEASLKSTVEKFAPEPVKQGQKTIYNNAETGIRIVYDDEGGYFRVQNTNLSGKRVYTDLDGKIPNNKIVNGKQTGRSQEEYNQVTHFKNTDN